MPTLLNQHPANIVGPAAKPSVAGYPAPGAFLLEESSPALPALEAEIVQSLQAAFSVGTAVLPDLDLYLRSKQGVFAFLVQGAAVVPPTVVADPLDQLSSCKLLISSVPVEVLIRCQSNPQSLSLAQLLVKNAAGLMESRKREEVLMEEIAADWESLSALCEINSEIFASSTITDGTYRLITRIASLRLGFHGALFLRRENMLECVVSTGRLSPPVRVDALGTASGDVGSAPHHRSQPAGA